MLLSELTATGAVVVKLTAWFSQSSVDQKAVIPGGNPEIVKFTPAAGSNEPNESYPIVIGGEVSVASGGGARLRVDGDAVVVIPPPPPSTKTFKVE